MRSVAKHLYFERRRLILAGLMAFVAGFGLHAHVNSIAFGLPFPVFTGLLYAFSVVLAAALTTYLLPTVRWLIEGVAVSRLGFAIWVNINQGQDIAASPIVNATIVVGGAIALMQLCDWIDKRCQTPFAPCSLLYVAALARRVFAWIDNKALRENRPQIRPQDAALAV